MKKYIILGIGIFFLILISGFANAALTDNLVSYWSFDTNADDDYASNDGTAVGATHTSTSCKLGGGCYNFDGNDYINISNEANFDFTATNATSVCMWLNLTATGSQALFSKGVGNIYESAGYYVGINGETRFNHYVRESDASWTHRRDNEGAGANADSAWQYYCFLYDGTKSLSTGIQIYKNGTRFDTTGTGGGSVDNILNNGHFLIGSGKVYADCGTCELNGGTIDEVAVWDKNLTLSEISDLWNGGAGYNFVGSPTVTNDTLNMSATTPTNGSQFNLNPIRFNTSVNSSFNFNCSLYINETLNITTLYPAGNEINVSFSQNFTEGNYVYYIWCVNNETNESSTNNTFYFDSVDPNIVVSGDINLSYVFAGFGNITGTINVSDSNLYGLNVTIDNDIIIFNITSIGATSYNYTLNFNPTEKGLSYGAHTLDVFVSDSHTLKSIPTYDYDRGLFDKSITYNFNDDWVKITPTTASLFSSFNTRKKKDRYSFELERDYLGRLLYGDDIEFKITSSHPITILKDSEYPGHLIVDGLNKWIDFDNDENGKVTVERINLKEVNVKITGIESDNIVFNSIGGLNVINRSYYFFYGNITETYINQTLETANNKFTLNFTRNGSFISDMSANLYYNGTFHTATKTTTAESIYFEKTLSSDLITVNALNHSFYWNFSMTGVGGFNLENVTNTTNQSVHKMIVTNCTAPATTQAINFSTLNLTNSAAVNSTMEGTFTVWNRTSSLSRTYPIVKNTASLTHGVCIYPSWGSFNTNYETEFSATGYNDASSIVNGGKLDSGQENISVYMTPTGDTTAITVTAVDELDNKLIGYIIEVYKYELATGNYTLVDTETTNGVGVVVFNLDVSTLQYQFRVKNPSGTLVHTEPKQKLTSTSYTLRVLLGTTPQYVSLQLQDLDWTFTIDRNNGTFVLIWDDTNNLINFANLTIMDINTTGKRSIYSAISTSNASMLSYNVSINRSQSKNFIGYFYVEATKDSQTYLLDTITFDFRKEWEVFGTDALIMAFLFIGTMMFIGISISPEGSIILTIVGMIGFWAMGFIEVSLTGLIPLVVVLIFIITRVKKQ